MIRRQYQEKFLKKELDKLEQIKHMEKEIDDVFYLFEELYETVKINEKEINIIEDTINQTKKDTIETEDTMIENEKRINELEYINNYVRYALVGGLGSLGFIFNTWEELGIKNNTDLGKSLYEEFLKERKTFIYNSVDLK